MIQNVDDEVFFESFQYLTSKDLLQNAGNSVQCDVAAWMGGEFGGERTHVYVWLSPVRCPPETITLSIGYNPKQNRRCF